MPEPSPAQPPSASATPGGASTSDPASPPRKPWPMKWVVFAVLIYMLIYNLYWWLASLFKK